VTETYVRSALAIIALIYWPFATVQPERRETRHSVYRTSIVQQITLELLAAITRYEKKTSESSVSASTENRQQYYLQCVR